MKEHELAERMRHFASRSTTRPWIRRLLLDGADALDALAARLAPLYASEARKLAEAVIERWEREGSVIVLPHDAEPGDDPTAVALARAVLVSQSRAGRLDDLDAEIARAVEVIECLSPFVDWSTVPPDLRALAQAVVDP